MIYGPFQYYKDELASWKRVIEFHKEELRESVCQLGALTDLNIISGANGKTGSAFTDQLMVQENQFDHIGNLIMSQHQRLDRGISELLSPFDETLATQQDLLRSKMNSIERIFLRTKYSCSIFLSTFLHQQHVEVAL